MENPIESRPFDQCIVEKDIISSDPPPQPPAAGQKFGDPGPLGLMAFGMTVILFQMGNAGIVTLNTTTAGVVMVYGGLVQIIAAVLECVRGNSFGCTVTGTYGAFWLATAIAWVLPRSGTETPNAELAVADDNFMGAFFCVWAVFAYGMLAASLRQPLTFIFLFFTAALNFTLQMISFWSHETKIMRVAGYEGIICGMTAMYCSLAITINDNYGMTVLPLLEHNRGRIISWRKRE